MSFTAESKRSSKVLLIFKSSFRKMFVSKICTKVFFSVIYIYVQKYRLVWEGSVKSFQLGPSLMVISGSSS